LALNLHAQNESEEIETEAETDTELSESKTEMENALQTGWDIDSVFDNATEEIPEETGSALISLRDKILLEATYGFIAGFAPGWEEAPWYDSKSDFDYYLGARLEALLSIDLPLTDALRVYNSFYFSIPDSAVFSIKEFFFEYNILERAFIKAGLYEIAWGISRFYPFTNLPVLVPSDDDTPGDALIARLIIPIGIGGFEFLAMTRLGYVDNFSSPQFSEFAYGTKYNLATRIADIDAGFMYHKKMPYRFFISIKTTIGNTELYSEGLIAVSQEEEHETYFSGNFGFLQDFFKGKLTLMGEIFYNGEPDVKWWRPKTDILDESTVDLYQGFNGALAFIIRPGILGMRIFTQALYSVNQESVWLIPGISISPGGITISLSVPMALGKRTDITEKGKGNYYRNNMDKYNRPFSILLGISFSKKTRFTL